MFYSIIYACTYYSSSRHAKEQHNIRVLFHGTLSEYVMTQSLSTISTINPSVDLLMYTIFFES